MSKFAIQATWDDVPHLTQQQKEELWASIPPFQRDARAKGIPQLGSGAIYPVPESEIQVNPFPIPKAWPRVYGLDVGWNRTAVLWAAVDDASHTTYFYNEHYRSGAEPAVHSAAIKARGDWIPGVIDPAARGRSQADGHKLIDLYTELGLILDFADNAVEAGIQATWESLSTGRIKVFSSLTNFFNEFRIYRRDEKGKIVKQNDHLMDAMRYIIMSGLRIAMCEPQRLNDFDQAWANRTRSDVTGY